MMDKKIYLDPDDYNFEKEVKELLLFRKIVDVWLEGDQCATLVLDNGTRLEVLGNEGCGGCSNGWYYITNLAKCDNAITDVICEKGLDEYDEDVYRIYVFAEDKKINCLEVIGHDNGWYGTGYSLTVTLHKECE